MADTQSMEIGGDPSCSSGGSVGERKTQQSSITHPVITVRGSRGASRHNAISHGVSTKQKPKLVKISRLKRNYTFHLVDRVLFKVINEGDCGERALASRLLMNRGGLWARRLGGAVLKLV